MLVIPKVNPPRQKLTALPVADLSEIAKGLCPACGSPLAPCDSGSTCERPDCGKIYPRSKSYAPFLKIQKRKRLARLESALDTFPMASKRRGVWLIDGAGYVFLRHISLKNVRKSQAPRQLGFGFQVLDDHRLPGLVARIGTGKLGVFARKQP